MGVTSGYYLWKSRAKWNFYVSSFIQDFPTVFCLALLSILYGSLTLFTNLYAMVYALYDSLSFFTRNTFSNWQVIFAEDRQKWNIRWSSTIFPLYFERLCCDHLIKFTPLFSPVRIFKHRCLRFLRIFTLDYGQTFQQFAVYYLRKYREKWNMCVHDNSHDI